MEPHAELRRLFEFMDQTAVEDSDPPFVEVKPEPCSLCCDDLGDDTVITEQDHKYHAACIEKYVSNNLQTCNLRLVCCKSNTAFSQSFVREAISSDLYNKYERFQLESYLKLADNVVRCGTPDCQFACELE